jgi:hypothetical protein
LTPSSGTQTLFKTVLSQTNLALSALPWNYKSFSLRTIARGFSPEFLLAQAELIEPQRDVVGALALLRDALLGA